jgi:hypothetical protein
MTEHLFEIECTILIDDDRLDDAPLAAWEGRLVEQGFRLPHLQATPAGTALRCVCFGNDAGGVALWAATIILDVFGDDVGFTEIAPQLWPFYLETGEPSDGQGNAIL